MRLAYAATLSGPVEGYTNEKNIIAGDLIWTSTADPTDTFCVKIYPLWTHAKTHPKLDLRCNYYLGYSNNAEDNVEKLEEWLKFGIAKMLGAEVVKLETERVDLGYGSDRPRL